MFSRNLESCSVGLQLNEKCHLLSYTRTVGFKKFDSLTVEQMEVLSMRAGIDQSPDLVLCHHHEQTMLQQYSTLQRSCCDPFLKHKKAAKGSLIEITLEASKEYRMYNMVLIPGKKLCPTCRRVVSKRMKSYKETELAAAAPLDDTYNSDSEQDFKAEFQREQVRENLDSSLESMDISPMKLHAVPSHSKFAYGKRKIVQVQSKLKQQSETIQKHVAEVLNVMPESIKPTERTKPSDYVELKKKANDLDILASLMKEKLKVFNRKKKIQILTMAPRSWSILQTANEFDVSEYMVRQARKIAAEKGIFELPDQKLDKDRNQIIDLMVCD